MATIKSPLEENEHFDAAKMYLWLKALEAKVNSLVREMDLLKNDAIKKSTMLRKDFKTLQDDVVELRHEQEKVMRQMDLMIKELKQTAGIEEVMTLRKYIDLWNPLTFVTQRDLERMIDAKLMALGVKKQVLVEKQQYLKEE